MKYLFVFSVFFLLLVKNKSYAANEANIKQSEKVELFQKSDDFVEYARDIPQVLDKANSTSTCGNQSELLRWCGHHCCHKQCHHAYHVCSCCTCKEGYPKDCAELKKNGITKSGVYKVDPDGDGEFQVYCDMVTAGGGWLVFQRRLDGSVDFFRGWNSYKLGFGSPCTEYWLGLEKIKRLTSHIMYELRVDLMDVDGKFAHACYDFFAVSGENTYYKLSLGTYYGTAGDSLSFHRGYNFSTIDNDHDSSPNNCALQYKGAWWYKSCYRSHLNGPYLGPGITNRSCVSWYTWKGHYYNPQKAEMKIRPLGFVGC